MGFCSLGSLPHTALLEYNSGKSMRFLRLCSFPTPHIEGDNAEAEGEVLEELDRLMFRHNSVPVGIGAKHSNVAHKAHCMYHAVYLETGTRELLSCFLAAITSITSDRNKPYPKFRHTNLHDGGSCGGEGKHRQPSARSSL